MLDKPHRNFKLMIRHILYDETQDPFFCTLLLGCLLLITQSNIRYNKLHPWLYNMRTLIFVYYQGIIIIITE
jgi:hypothetical protein